jgi:glycogen phosphorylase
MKQPSAETVSAARDKIVAKLTYVIGKDPKAAKSHDWLNATILAVRDTIIDRWMESTRSAYEANAKRVYYLSLEFLIGRLLRDSISNLGLTETYTAALKQLGTELDIIEVLEPDAALGNGGLGRLAACFMESMATLEIPAYGYGIRYEHGLFRQAMKDGWQTEFPETWLKDGNHWEFPRRESAYRVGFGGHATEDGGRGAWHPAEVFLATASDTPVVGWQGRRVNTLRLWSARAIDPIHLGAFNSGDFARALSDHNRAEILSRVLYPSDSTPAGQELRLRQEFFFTSASLQDILRRHMQHFGVLTNLSEKIAVQLNDTHPAIAIAELMRLLVDEHSVAWEEAWKTTQAVCGYTNHTLLPEALESWPVPLMQAVLPRHMQIIYRINALMLKEAATVHGVTPDVLRAVSLIDEHGEKRVRMGNLAFVGSHSINGVSALHTDLMKDSVFKNLNFILPGRINNKTNGVTPRRWLANVNPDLSKLLGEAAGTDVADRTDLLSTAKPMAKDAGFRDRFSAIKRANKQELAYRIEAITDIKVDPAMMFDVQIKRIHEYKRQLLNILEAIATYLDIKAGKTQLHVPRVKIFAGKAAASYAQAKLIIKLANDVAQVVNADSVAREWLRVVFMPNYNVSMAEVIVPATDLSEQISTAGMEASGTGNMKFAFNGALTIGTLDGANVEMREHVGAENFFLFGLTAEEVEARRQAWVDGSAVIAASPSLSAVVEALASGQFSGGDRDRYRPILDALRGNDWFMVASDFEAYRKAQGEVAQLWRNQSHWTEKAIVNSVSMGWFSSDRTIKDYAREIWNVPVKTAN